MWRAVVLVVLAGVPATWGFEYDDLYSDVDENSDNDDSDLYDHYKEAEAGSRIPVMSTDDIALTRARRDERGDHRTLIPEEIHNTRDEMKQIISENTEISTIPEKINSLIDTYDYAIREPPKLVRKFSDEEIKSWLYSEGVGRSWVPVEQTIEESTSIDVIQYFEKRYCTTVKELQQQSAEVFDYQYSYPADKPIEKFIYAETTTEPAISEDLPDATFTISSARLTPIDTSDFFVTVVSAMPWVVDNVDMYGLLDIMENLTYDFQVNLTRKFKYSLFRHGIPTCGISTRTATFNDATELDLLHSYPIDNDIHQSTRGVESNADLDQEQVDAKQEMTIPQQTTLRMQTVIPTSIGVNTTNDTKACTAKSVDINDILAIIANLTYDYEWNLTQQFKEHLLKYGVPTCPTRIKLLLRNINNGSDKLAALYLLHPRSPKKVELDGRAYSEEQYALREGSSTAGITNSTINATSTLSNWTDSTSSTRSTTEVSTTSSWMVGHVDINAILAIIANLTYDYEWNLTQQFNESLIKHGVPTCPTTTTETTTTTTTTPPPYDFANTSVVAKCFVCGLNNLEIPREAICSDAFSGDFIPLLPVDHSYRSQITSLKKYCRFLDVHNYVENPLEPRSIYGRFTGGCGVRWTDLTGVYTQRTCRNRYKPLMGKHFASKRMAKLELALINVENGCIVSPMATLLPLSRGISLYARFHACVCTGNWCNSAVTAHPWNVYITILWYIVINGV